MVVVLLITTAVPNKQSEGRPFEHQKVLRKLSSHRYIDTATATAPLPDQYKMAHLVGPFQVDY